MVNINPNEKLWQQYEDFAEKRGELVARVLSTIMPLSGNRILDYGCGTGGISRTLAKHGAVITAFDVDDNRLRFFRERIDASLNIEIVPNLSSLKPASFDCILLVDVIEHVADPLDALRTCQRLLKPGGFLYVTTPNKFSLLNMVCDPHFSLPFVGLLSRRHVQRVIGGWLKWQPVDRIDYPELLSMKTLTGLLLQADFTWQFVNRTAACYAVAHPQSLWNRPWHLRFVQHPAGNFLLNVIAKKLSDHKGFFNYFINPTWFVIAKKSPFSE